MASTTRTETIETCKDRPLVSYAIFSFNQERYVRESLLTALAQDYSPLEIIISDDCSTDRTFEVIRETTETYTGPHRLTLNRNSQNLGLARHVNEVLGRARGSLIVMASGDDLSLPQRTTRVVEAWLNAGRPKAVYCDFSCIDEKGNDVAIPRKLDALRMVVAEDQPVLGFLVEGVNRPPGCTEAISAELHRMFGPLNDDCYAEDKAFAFRALLTGEILRLPDCLVKYRLHGQNLSGDHLPHQVKRGAGRAESEAVFAKRRSWRITRLRQHLVDLTRAQELRLIDDDLFHAAEHFLRDSIELDDRLMRWWTHSWWKRLTTVPSIIRRKPRFTKWALIRLLPRSLFEYLRP